MSDVEVLSDQNSSDTAHATAQGSTVLETVKTDNSPVRSRFVRAEKEARGRLFLTERDEALLVDLFVHQAMGRGQIQALHFGSVPRCNMRLRKLFDHGYVVRDFHPMAPYGTQGIYRIGPKAANIVARRIDADAAYVRQICRGSKRPEFLEHTLAIVDFYLSVRAAVSGAAVSRHTDAHTGARSESITIDCWMPELSVRHEYDVETIAGWKKQVFKPDAFLRLQSGGGLWPFFIEIDRGNASSNLFGQKVEHYRLYQQSGLFTEMYGATSFRTLTVTTGEKRLAHLRDVVAQRGGDFFWFTTSRRLSESGPLAPIWQSADQQADQQCVGRDTASDSGPATLRPSLPHLLELLPQT